VEGLGNFGNPTGEIGTVERTNENDAGVRWDDDGRVRIGQPWLKEGLASAISYQLEEVGKWLLNYARNANKHTPGLFAITMKKVNAPTR